MKKNDPLPKEYGRLARTGPTKIRHIRKFKNSMRAGSTNGSNNR